MLICQSEFLSSPEIRGVSVFHRVLKLIEDGVRIIKSIGSRKRCSHLRSLCQDGSGIIWETPPRLIMDY